MIIKLHIFAGEIVRPGVTLAHCKWLLLEIPAEQSRGTVVTMAKQVLLGSRATVSLQF